MGLDIGKSRIGVALSDETETIATPLTTLDARREDTSTQTERIRRLCDEHGVSVVVIGLPLSMSGGDRGESAQMAKSFGRNLTEALGVKVVYLDERFSSVQAERALLDANLPRKRRKSVIDKVAASLILQTYLDRQNRDGH